MGVLPDYKEWIELAKKAGNVEAQEQIMQLREEHLRHKEELLTLREEYASLRRRLETTETLKFDDPYYWRLLPDGKDGPYCQVCYDNNGKLVRLSSQSTQGVWCCGVCEKFIHDKSFVRPPRRNGGDIARMFRD